jgi:nitronate monooxygenase
VSAFDVAGLAAPIVQAPMAGGPSTPELAVAVCEAGGLGFLAAGYRSAADLDAEIAAVRAATGAPFGVNIFAPPPAPADPAAVAAYARRLGPEADRHGVELGEPRFDDDGWERKLELVCEQRVPVVSFTFGLPAGPAVERLQAAGAAVWITVTNPAEARAATLAGADALVLQGTEAGGHRGGFLGEHPGLGLLALLRLVAGAVSIPRFNLWAGEAHALARPLPAGEIVARLAGLS